MTGTLPKVRKCRCGGEPSFFRNYSSPGWDRAEYEIRCELCGMGTDVCSTRDMAVVKWNSFIISKNRKDG